MSRVLALIATGRLRRGEVRVLEVLHDPRCACPQGGTCTCDPDLVLDGRRVEVATS